MRAWIWSAVAWGSGGPPQARAQLGVDDPVRLAGAVAPGADQAVQFLAEGGEVTGGSPAGGGAAAGAWGGLSGWAWVSRVRAASWDCWRLLSRVRTWSGSSRPGRPRKSSSSGEPAAAAAVPNSPPSYEDPVEVDGRVEGLEGGLVQRSVGGVALALGLGEFGLLGRRLRRRRTEARGPVRPQARRRTRAGPAPRAGTPRRSRPACGPGRTGPRPGRSTGRWTRWWRTRRRPAAGCPRPRRPSGRRPSSARPRRRTRRSSWSRPGRRTAPRRGGCPVRPRSSEA